MYSPLFQILIAAFLLLPGNACAVFLTLSTSSSPIPPSLRPLCFQEPNGTLVFDYLLSALLDITQSPYGFIHSALLKADGTPYLKVRDIVYIVYKVDITMVSL